MDVPCCVFVLSLAAFAALVTIYGHDLEYRFEIAAISINWSALTIGGGAAALHFRRLQSSKAETSREA